MKSRPSNTALKIFIGILVVLGLYVFGGLLIKARREAQESPEVRIRQFNSQLSSISSAVFSQNSQSIN